MSTKSNSNQPGLSLSLSWMKKKQEQKTTKRAAYLKQWRWDRENKEIEMMTAKLKWWKCLITTAATCTLQKLTWSPSVVRWWCCAVVAATTIEAVMRFCRLKNVISLALVMMMRLLFCSQMQIEHFPHLFSIMILLRRPCCRLPHPGFTLASTSLRLSSEFDVFLRDELPNHYNHQRDCFLEFDPVSHHHRLDVLSFSIFTPPPRCQPIHLGN